MGTVQVELDRLRQFKRIQEPRHVFQLIIHPKITTLVHRPVDVNTATLAVLNTLAYDAVLLASNL